MNDWENPKLLHRHRLPARAHFFPYPDAASALSFERAASPWFFLLDGVWKFHYANNPAKPPADFFEPGFDAGGWGDIRVPCSWQMLGYGRPHYTTYSFPSPWTLPACPRKTRPAPIGASSSCRRTGRSAGSSFVSTAWTPPSMSG